MEDNDLNLKIEGKSQRVNVLKSYYLANCYIISQTVTYTVNFDRYSHNKPR